MSVTFRQYNFKQIIEYTKLADLSCIEWGGDIHVPYNNIENADTVSEQMRENNLATASYGSYYHLGQFLKPEFYMILETAKKISAPVIRAWGGVKSSRDLDIQSKSNILSDVLDISRQTEKAGIKISLEYHDGTITDTAESALDFMREVRKQGGDNIYLYWQPNPSLSFGENRQELIKICPYLSNIHVFACEKSAWLPLAEHRDKWRSYIDIIKDSGGNHDFLLEFVKGDEAGQMLEDAKILIDLLEKIT